MGQMYTIEPEINDTTESKMSAPYLDLLLSIGREGLEKKEIYDSVLRKKTLHPQKIQKAT